MEGHVKAITIIAGGSASAIFGTDADRSFIITLAAIVALVVYCLYRKLPKEKLAGKLDFVERNLAVLVLSVVIAPGVFREAMNLANAIIKLLT